MLQSYSLKVRAVTNPISLSCCSVASLQQIYVLYLNDGKCTSEACSFDTNSEVSAGLHTAAQEKIWSLLCITQL